MINLEDIRSLSDFKRHSGDLIRDMKQHGRPIVLTVNGKAELVVQNAVAYQRLLDVIDRLEAIEGIKKGVSSMERGEGRAAQDVFNDLRASDDG